METLVYDPSTGGASHIKVESSTGFLLNKKAVVAASLAIHTERNKCMEAHANELQGVLTTYEPGACVDKSTPADGHCLFHACVSGGLFTEHDIGCRLSVVELRQMVFSLATPEQIRIAAVGSGTQGLTDAAYIQSMMSDGWGDNLMISLLSKCFKKDITVLTCRSARTFFADGNEQDGTSPTSIWIAHHSEFHYYGVLRGNQVVAVSPAAVVVDAQDQLVKKRRLTGKSADPTNFQVAVKTLIGSKKGLPSKSMQGQDDDRGRLCGNCGLRGHQAVTCTQPCFACGGAHKYFECDDPEVHHVAKRQANRNRVQWKGFGASHKSAKGRTGMKEHGAGKFWVRKEYDPEYTPQRDISPKRAALLKTPHPSDRCKTSLRILWDQTEEQSMNSLIDGGFLTDTCLNKNGSELPCPGTLCVQYSCRAHGKGKEAGEQTNRKLGCVGVAEKHRHRFHWLAGSVFQGHYKLDAKDVTALLESFAASKSPEESSIDTGLNRDTVRHLLDRLRMASALVAVDQRQELTFDDCQIEADETVVRKERVYAQEPGGPKVRTGTWHHSVICLTQRGSTKQVMYMCEAKFVAVAQSGKPSAPSLPSVDLVLPLLSTHFGRYVVLHTDGADAYRSACEQLKAEGYLVVQDHVVHSKGQYSAFGRHDVSADDRWESCSFALLNPDGERRIRVIKGTQKAEGLWRHLKHGSAGIPKEVHNDDQRLDMYAQSLVWRMQCCGCPYREVLRMCRAFRSLPLIAKNFVFNYGITYKDAEGKKKVCLDKPPVTYCKWHLAPEEEQEEAEEE
jgi:hypothetical protein